MKCFYENLLWETDLWIKHGNEKVKGIIRIRNDNKQCCPLVTYHIQFHLIIRSQNTSNTIIRMKNDVSTHPQILIMRRR